MNRANSSHFRGDGKIDFLVSSMGGCGTTLLLDFLQSHTSLNVNPSRGLHNPLKHPLRPPPIESVKRALFLFGCPRNALLSLFRRKNDALHFANVNGRFEEIGAPKPPPLVDAWQQCVERFDLVPTEEPHKWMHRDETFMTDDEQTWFIERKRARFASQTLFDEWLEKTAAASYQGLGGYLQRGEDLMRWQEQVQGWLEADPAYPILFVRYESLWENLDDVFDFIGVESSKRRHFQPFRARASNWSTRSADEQANLKKLFAPLEEMLEQIPDVFRRNPK